MSPHQVLVAPSLRRTRVRHAVDPHAVVLRPAGPSDHDGLAQMLSSLSVRSLHLRFFGGVRVTDKVVDTLLTVDRRGGAFVATEQDRVVAHAMWAPADSDGGRVEIAFVVAEDHRGRGLATRLTRLALDDACTRGSTSVEATVLADNPAALRVVQRLLPTATVTHRRGEIAVVAPLRAEARGRGTRRVAACRP